MIIGKNSALKGFGWFAASLIKLIVSIATMAHFQTSPFLGVVGILSLVLFAGEQVYIFRKLSK